MCIVLVFALYGIQFHLQIADNAAENDRLPHFFSGYFNSSNRGPKKKIANYHTHVFGFDFDL
jgi:hypothetical protein